MWYIRYRITLFLIITTLLWVAFFRVSWPDIVSVWLFVRDTIEGIWVDTKTGVTEIKTVQLIHIPITEITSDRYLYTLKKEIMKQSSGSILTGTIIPPYGSYSQQDQINTDFIFRIHDNQDIKIPMSSYFFDIWNNTPANTVSGESLVQGEDNKSDKKVIALTFDDGPSPKYTNTLLDILKRENVKATFFVLGRNAELYPKILVRENAEWHEIGNHSYSHVLFTKIDEGAMQEEIYKTDQAIYHAIWEYPQVWRPPYGGTNTWVLSTVHMPAILWSIDTLDWKTHNIVKNINSIKNAKDGDIIIMHDIHKASVASVEDVIRELRSRGFTFVTVSELLWLSDSNKQIGKKCTKKWHCK